MKTDRYDRQRRIPGWNQDALSRSCVLVAGAGALGNELIKNLALLGVGQILIIDFDLIEVSNLSRTLFFEEKNLGRPKAEVAAAGASRLNPEVNLRYINGDLFRDIGLGFYRHSDLVISGLDNLAARSETGISCALAGVPFLDGGVWAMGGEVRWFIPGDGPCFECGLSDASRTQRRSRYSCSGLRLEGDLSNEPIIPTNISTASIIGGLLAQESVRYLCNLSPISGEALVYNGLSRKMHRAELPTDPNCKYHAQYEGVIELSLRAGEITATDLLKIARANSGEPGVLELGRDFLLGFDCSTCGSREEMNMLAGLVEESKATCLVCGSNRTPEIISRLEGNEECANRTLSALGIPPGEVLAVHTKEKLCLYELTGDVTAFWA